MIPSSFITMGLPQKIPLTFRAEQANSTVTLNAVGSPTVSGLKYRTPSTGGWQTYTLGTTITMAAVGDTVQFWNSANTLSTYGPNYVNFSMTGTISAHGNVMSLLNFSSAVPPYGFYKLFNECSSLISAPELPAKTLGEKSYIYMFYSCTGLVHAPCLPATDLSNTCYQQMFMNCSALRDAPKISATRLAWGSCYYMFSGCHSLVHVDDLRATALDTESYRAMFSSCTSLVSGPKIYINSVNAEKGLHGMFASCQNLTYLEVCFTNWNNANSQVWLNNVPASGTFRCPSGLTIPSRDENGVPSGWTIVNQ